MSAKSGAKMDNVDPLNEVPSPQRMEDGIYRPTLIFMDLIKY